MQNEDTPTEVNPFMDIAAGMSKPPAAPTIPTDNPFMDLAPSVRTVSQPPAMGSLSAVAGINPDQAAEATKLGTPLGIGQDLALRNMDELRRRSMIASVQRSGMLQNNPRLAQSLLDPVFAAQAHDDLDSLEKTSSLFDKAVNFIGPELFDRRPGQALRIAKVLEDGYAIGELGAELGALKSRRKGYIAFGGTPENETVLNDRIAFLEKQLANKEPSGFFGSAAMVTAQALAMARPVGTVALMGAGVGGAVGGPPGAAAGFVAGLQAGIVGTSAQVEGGFLFDDMVAQGVEPETAYYASVAGGTVIGIIELVGDRLFAGSFKPITRFLRQELTQQLAKPTIRSAAAEFGKQTLKQMAVGGAEEGSQRLVADAFSELGKAIDGVPTDFTWSQMAKNIASDFAAGVQGSALIGAAGPGLSLMVDVRRAEAVAAQQEFFDGLDAAKKDGKLPKRNLDAYEGFLARQAKGTTTDTVYVEAEAAAQVLAQSGLSVTELEKVLPGIREQLQNALENGGDITIPTSVYGAKLSGTQIGDALRPHMRLSPEAMSVAQAQEFSRKRDALRQEAQAALAERQEADAAFVESAQKVETTVAEQLRQTGMQDIEVRANAELFRDLAVTQAARMGITPEQFYERYPYRVRGPQAVQEGAPLEQAVSNKELRNRAFMAEQVLVSRSDPRFETAPAVRLEGTFNNPNLDRPVTQISLAELNLLGDRVYHETSPKNVLSLLKRLEGGQRRHEGLYVSDNIDLALGQGGRGVVLELDPSLVNGKVNKAKVLEGAIGREFIVDKSLVGNVRAVIFADEKTANKFREQLAPVFDVDRPTTVEQGIRFERRAEAKTSKIASAVQEGQPLEQAAQIPKVDGVALRRAMNQYIRGERSALEVMDEVNLFGLVTEAEVDELLDQDERNFVAGVSSRGGGSTSLPSEMGRRGQHPLLALVRQREKERPTAIARRDAFYLDAVQRDDITQAEYMVDQAAYAQGYRVEAFHGTDAKDFSAFKYGDTYNWGPALYFSPSREYAAEYLDRTGEGEPRVMRVKLRIENMFSPESNPEHTKLYRRLAKEARDDGLTHQEFDISGPQGTSVKYGNYGLSNLVTYTDQWWLVEKLWREGFDGFRTTEADGETVGIAVRDPSQVKLADPVTRDESGNVVPLSRRFDITSPKVFEQAARAPRGDFDPAKLMTTLREGRDFSTFAHETAHFYLTILADIARSATGPQQTKADMDALLSWFGIEGATPAERLAKWSSLTIDQQRQYHEQFAYSFEIYLHEGKAPSVEMQSLFNQFAAWLKRVYKSIRDELNATYKAQFGRDLPMMNSEIRLVMDRMLATDEQIARAQAVRGMKAMFQTQEQSGMNDAEWAAYQALEQDATDAATAELTKATLKELQWYGNAQSKYLREIQSKHDRARKEIREEVSAQVQLEPVYRAMEFLKKGTIRTDTGEVTAATGAFKLDLAKVRAIMPAGFDPASLKYGKYGMVQEGGIDPDMAAGMFGYGSGVELINAILGAKPIKEEIDARTDQRMLDENSDLATPEARQAAVDMAIHNDFRARIIAVEQRWLEKSTRPVNDMMQAARQVAQDIIGDVVIRTLNPRRYEAAEAEAARTATTAYREPQDPSTAGQAAATRAYNEAIAAGQTTDEATVAATEAGVAAVAKAQERRAEFNAKYGGREPAEVARRAKRQQLVQNQLAREAMLAKEEIAAAGRDFRKFFRSDEKLAKTRDMAPIMAARAILSYYGYGKRGESPAQYLEQLRTYAPELYDQIAPIVLKSLSGTADYRDLTVTEFRVLRDTVQALWAQARRDRQITVEGERVALDVVLKELTDRLETIGVGERVGQRQAPGVIDRANRHLLGLRAMMSRVEAWADALDGMAGPGAFTKYLFRPVKQAVDAYRIERNKYVERFVKLLDGIDLPVGKIAAPELNYTFGNGNGGIGRAELLGALMHTGNEGNYRKLLLGRGWGELDADGNLDDSRWRSFVARMISEGKLTKADYDVVQSIWDLLEEIKPLAQRAHFDMYGYYFKEVEATEVVTPFGTYRGGYVPAATDKFMVQDARVNASMDELEGDWRNSLPSTGAGFTKGRVDYNEALSLDLRLIATHTDAVLRFSMIQPSVKDALKILRDRDLKALLERFDPAVMENMLLPWLNRAARQQATEPGRWKLADKFWGGVRSRAGVATMFANLRNALQQVTGWFPSLLKVKRRYLQSALMTYLGSPKQTAEAVARLSPFMADRMRNQMFELQGTMNELLLNPSKYEKLQQWSSKHGYFLQQAFQNMVDVTTWQGAYNQALAEGETQAEAVARGDAAVRLTQGSLSPEDLSMFEVGTPFYRTFVQFTGYFNMLANLNLGEFQKTVRDMGWRSGKGRLLYIYVMGMLLPAIVSDAIVRSLGGGWDDEDEDGYMDVFMDWFFGSQVRMGAALLPFGSTAYTAITTAFNDKPYDDRITTSPSIAALESATIGTSKAIIAVTDEDKEVTGRNVRDVLTLITLLTGVPVSALGRPAGYLIDVERGEIEPESGYDMIRGMITGTATPESKR